MDDNNMYSGFCNQGGDYDILGLILRLPRDLFGEDIKTFTDFQVYDIHSYWFFVTIIAGWKIR
jgi:hypothetical protein